MANKRVKKIAMFQSDHEYPSLNVMVTSNTRYWKDRLTVLTVEEAVKKIEAWLRKATK